ncbi:hypothetical protein SAMN00777080_1385 [Aquiflexum balticum DSM 16537]|uniref:Potassium channel domain-containing protein n=1 Tax=Aquiflexum balticum DSM 16537 TaxID=758820 RepID=A0A1W2H1K1_9BACT|nr:potassium channel family protein [Aquiflexum balticum]SMD42820.1 hypothetical protein SAMN00777080_1385 [Aquiflexum balticum DSM 16537]
MRKLIFALLLIASLPCLGQDRTEMSFSQLFQKIDQSKDSVFKLTHAKITFDPLTDQRFSNSDEPKDSIFIDKAVELKDVIFEERAKINYISFKRPVSLVESGPFQIRNCSFAEGFSLRNSEKFELLKERTISGLWYNLSNNLFLGSVVVRLFGNNPNSVNSNFCQLHFNNNTITTDLRRIDLNNAIVMIFGHDLVQVAIRKNKIEAINGGVYFEAIGSTRNAFITGNIIRSEGLSIKKNDDMKEFELRDNKIESPIFLGIDQLRSNYIIDWKDLKENLFSGTRYLFFHLNLYDSDTIWKTNIYSEEFVNRYRNTHRIENEYAFNAETSLLGSFQNHYLENHNRASSNAVFVAIKDLETQRLVYLYREDPTFKTYFTWKVNQFLKIFSAYGTEPARAIIFSVYVILAFALIYLFFPNSWDAHGKNRIVDRYRFFFKYLQRNAGIHEVYLEEKRQDLLDYEEFKSMITDSEKSVPRFFAATALPLYQWAVSGTRLTAKILSKVDILKGTWEDLPASQKVWKSFLLVGGFLIALVYDLLIKVLNALMLSINTFTTLGFGEIPIKGLPRYLAIIQGFIGWFMLTIFGVSLISQLLN